MPPLYGVRLKEIKRFVSRVSDNTARPEKALDVRVYIGERTNFEHKGEKGNPEWGAHVVMRNTQPHAARLDIPATCKIFFQTLE